MLGVNMKAIRIFYNQAGEILGNCGLEGPGDFPYPVAKMIEKYPANIRCLEIQDNSIIDRFLTAEGNRIENDSLQLGTPITSPPLPPMRDIFTELDGLKADVEKLKLKTKAL